MKDKLILQNEINKYLSWSKEQLKKVTADNLSKILGIVSRKKLNDDPKLEIQNIENIELKDFDKKNIKDLKWQIFFVKWENYFKNWDIKSASLFYKKAIEYWFISAIYNLVSLSLIDSILSCPSVETMLANFENKLDKFKQYNLDLTFIKTDIENLFFWPWKIGEKDKVEVNNAYLIYNFEADVSLLEKKSIELQSSEDEFLTKIINIISKIGEKINSKSDIENFLIIFNNILAQVLAGQVINFSVFWETNLIFIEKVFDILPKLKKDDKIKILKILLDRIILSNNITVYNQFYFLTYLKKFLKQSNSTDKKEYNTLLLNLIGGKKVYIIFMQDLWDIFYELWNIRQAWLLYNQYPLNKHEFFKNSKKVLLYILENYELTRNDIGLINEYLFILNKEKQYSDDLWFRIYNFIGKILFSKNELWKK